MTLSPHTVTPFHDLRRLVSDALAYLEMLDYNRRTIRRYRTTWGHFIEFACNDNGAAPYSSELTQQFLADVRASGRSHIDPFTDWRAHVTFEMDVLEQFARDGVIKRRIINSGKISISHLG